MSLSNISKKMIIRIAKRHGAKSLSLFGSTARGEEQKSSDIDLLVEFEKGRSLIDLVRLERELEEELATRFDVVTPNSLHPRIRERVNKEKVPML
jgi:uncharacterized protein